MMMEPAIQDSVTAGQKVGTVLWRVPDRNPDFNYVHDAGLGKSRKQLLDSLTERFQQHADRDVVQQVVLTGMGGVGKTQLALEYAHLNKDRYSLVCWISAANGLDYEFCDLATEVFSIRTMGLTWREIVSRVYAKLATLSDWLLIIDNAEDHTMLAKYLPTTSATELNQHILITARNRQWQNSIFIDTFTIQESIFYVLKHLQNTKTADAALLVNKLGLLPLAINNAVRYISENQLAILDYVKIWEYKFRDDHDQYDIIFNTLLLSLDKIQSYYDGLSYQVICLCAYLSSDRTPVMLLKNYLHLVPDSDRIIILLDEYSLINLSVDGKYLSIHRLIQMAVRAKLQDEGNEQEVINSLLQLLYRNFPYDRNHQHLIVNNMHMIPVVDNLINYLEEASLFVASNELAELIINLGQYYAFEYRDNARANEALHKAIRMLDNNEVCLPYELEARLYNTLGYINLFAENFDYNAGRRWFKKAAVLCKDSNDTHLAFALFGLGKTSMMRQKYNEAMQFFYRAVHIINERVGWHLDKAVYCNSLASAYAALGNFNDAVSYYEQAIRIGRRLDVADAHYGLATLLLAVDKKRHYEEILKNLQKALEIYQMYLGADSHPNLVRVYELLKLLGGYEDPGMKIARDSQQTVYVIDFDNGQVVMSKQEAQCLVLALDGKSNEQIAVELALSVSKIEMHLGLVKRKLNFTDNLEWLTKVPKQCVLDLRKALG